jgi:hypothetical protein
LAPGEVQVALAVAGHPVAVAIAATRLRPRTDPEPDPDLDLEPATSRTMLTTIGTVLALTAATLAVLTTNLE